MNIGQAIMFYIEACLAAVLACDHGVTFEEGTNLSADEVRQRWPRLYGTCPKGCGFHGIAYASMSHYASGDW